MATACVFPYDVEYPAAAAAASLEEEMLTSKSFSKSSEDVCEMATGIK